MKNIILIAFLALGITANAQWFGKKKIRDNGNITTETRSVSDFEDIRVTGSFDVYLTKGATDKVEVETSENILPYIITEVKNGVLNISFKEGYNYQINKKLEVRVGIRPLKKIELTGSGGIQTWDNVIVQNDVISCILSGSGDIELPLKANKVNVILSGSGDIELSGTANFLDITLNGSGDVETDNIKAQKAKVALSGSGDVSLYVSEEIKASVIGSGEIEVKGKPKKEDTYVMGSGSIKVE